MAERRKDSKKRVLKEGEYQRSNGTYEYRWRSENGKRNNVYAKSLEELREKEAEIQRDRSDGIRAEARNATINDIHEQWLQLKKGLKANTLVNYEYMYKMYVFPEFGKRKVGSLKKSDVVLQRPCGFTAFESGNGGEHPYRAASGAGFCSGGRISPYQSIR